MKPSKGLATGAAVVLGTGLAAGMGTQVLFSQICMRRDKPAALKLLEQSDPAPVTELDRQIRAGRQALEQTPHETVDIAAYDGVSLRGHLVEAASPRRLVLAMHGWRSAWSRDFSLSWPFWRDAGCTVLYPEQRGTGESGGSWLCFGAVERYDCLYWLRYLESRYGTGLPIYLCGISMGAATVLMAPSLDLPASVHGILADCGFTSPFEIWKHVYESCFHLPFRNGRLCRKFFKAKTGFDLDEADTRKILARSRIPLLLIHGGADDFVPADMSRENYAAAAGPKKLLIVEGAAHGLSYAVDQPAYEAAVLDFFAQHDAP